MPSVLISGSNRGLGLEFARQYAEAGWTVHGTARNLASAGELAALGSNVHVHELDVASARSVENLALKLEGEPIDVVIANSAIFRDFDSPIDTMGWDEFRQVIETNTLGALRLARALLPNLERSERKLATAMSSLMSSIASNNHGTQHVYRASKSALNAVWHALAEEWRPRGVACVLIRPGWVRTDMTGYRGELDPPESVAGLRSVIERLTIADAGRLISYNGTELPW